ncbi:MAG: ATP-binding protein [Thermodesulfobacteriota bacterium]
MSPEFMKKEQLFSLIASGEDSTRQFKGNIKNSDSLAFVMRNLHKVQAGRSVNAPGLPEIPESVFEELLVNALIHRDYLVSASIRLFIFDNRIEIISPGHLPNNLTVEKIRAGISNIRNPILVSFVAKGLLPYHGLGSGIKRALEGWPDIDFADDREGFLFTATVHRKKQAESQKSSPKSSVKSSGKSSGKTEDQVLGLLSENPRMTIPELAKTFEITTRGVEKQITKLRRLGRLRRVGPAKGGYWEVVEK